jgi:shikimate kinase
MDTPHPALRVAVVGPCAAGKSTLIEALRAAGYDARHPAQEHSFVPNMWQRLVAPDVLVFLDVDYPTYLARRPHQDPGPAYLAEQHHRLAHAREHADLMIDTSDQSAEAVRETVLAFLAGLRGE